MPPQVQDTATGFSELVNFRKKYPQYNDLDDEAVVTGLAKKYPKAYGDLPEKYNAFKSTKTIDPNKEEIVQTAPGPEVKTQPEIKDSTKPYTPVRGIDAFAPPKTKTETTPDQSNLFGIDPGIMNKSLEKVLPEFVENKRQRDELSNKLNKGIQQGRETVEPLSGQKLGDLKLENAPMGDFRNAINSFANSGLKMVPGTIEAIGLIGDKIMQRGLGTQLNIGDFVTPSPVISGTTGELGKGIREGIDSFAKVDPKVKGFFASTLPSAFGSAFGFMAGGMIGSAVKIPTLLTTLTLSMSQAAEEYNSALEQTGDHNKAYQTFIGNLPFAATEVVPFERLFSRLNKLGGKRGTQLLMEMFTQGTVEGSQEVIQQFGANLNAKMIYDASRKLSEGTLEGGAAGFFTGMLLAGMGGIASKRLDEGNLSEAEIKDLSKTIETVNLAKAKVEQTFKEADLHIDKIARDLQNPVKVKNGPKDHYKMTDQQTLVPPTKDIQNEVIPETIAETTETELPPAETANVEESPEFKQQQIAERQRQKQITKIDTDNYAELNRQVKNASRKRSLYNLDQLKQNIDLMQSPEMKVKAQGLLDEAIKNNEKLQSRNTFSLENLAFRKYGKNNLNELEEDQQQSLLAEYNEMKKQGIAEFKPINTVPSVLKGVSYPEAIAPIQPQRKTVLDLEKQKQAEAEQQRQKIEAENKISKDSNVAGEDINLNPTDAQKEAGNYKKAHIEKNGFGITIENPKGSIRSGKDQDGETWETKLNNDYGYILGTTGKDKDHLDVFLADDYQDDASVFIVNQTTPDGKFDEHKVMLGFEYLEDAEEAYLNNYGEGKAHYTDIVEMPMDRFKKWSGKKNLTSKPAQRELGFLEKFDKLPKETQNKIRNDYQEEYDKATDKDAVNEKYQELVDKELETKEEPKPKWKNDLSKAPEGAFAVKLTDGKIIYDKVATNHTELMENNDVEELDVVDVGFVSEGKFLTTKELSDKIKKEVEAEKKPKADNNKAAIKRMIGQGKSIKQIAKALNLSTDEVIEQGGYKDLEDYTKENAGASVQDDQKSGKATTIEVDEDSIGKNKNGEFLYEDAKGVRYRLEGEKRNIKVTEPVSMIPTKGGIVMSTDRTDDEWLTEKELKEKNKGDLITKDLTTGEETKFDTELTDTIMNIRKLAYDSKDFGEFFSLLSESQKEVLVESTLVRKDKSNFNMDDLVFFYNRNKNPKSPEASTKETGPEKSPTGVETSEEIMRDAKGYPIAIDDYGYEHTIKLFAIHAGFIKTGENTGQIAGSGWEWYGFKKSGDIWEGFVHGFEDEYGSFSESELKENGINPVTDPKELLEIMPPIGWKWKMKTNLVVNNKPPKSTKAPEPKPKANVISAIKTDKDLITFLESQGKNVLLDSTDELAELIGKNFERNQLPPAEAMLFPKEKSNLIDKMLQMAIRKEAKGKQPYEMSLEAFATKQFLGEASMEAGMLTEALYIQVRDYKKAHQKAVQEALDQGKEINPIILKDHPEITGKKPETKPEPPSVIDDDMKNIIKDIEKGLEGITFQLKKPDSKKDIGFKSVQQKKKAEPFYSKLRQTILNKLPGKFVPSQLSDLLKSGEIKEAEIKWSGIQEWLKEKGPDKISKQEVLDFLKANDLQIKEVQKGEGVTTLANTTYYLIQNPETGEELDGIMYDSEEEAQTALDEAVSGGVDDAEGIGEFVGYDGYEIVPMVDERDGGWEVSDTQYKQLKKLKVDDELDLFGFTILRTESHEYQVYREGEPNQVDYYQNVDSIVDYLNDQGGLEQSDTPAKFAQYVLPGGENYKETLYTLPITTLNKVELAEYNEYLAKLGEGRGMDVLDDKLDRYYELSRKAKSGKGLFESSHWDEPNVLAHTRTNDRTVNGKKYLHIEEVQSDWALAGRKAGFQTVSKEKIVELKKETLEQGKVLAKQLREIGNLGFDSGEEAARALRNDPYFEDKWDLNPAIIKTIKLYQQAYREEVNAEGSVPDMPFKNNWHEFVLKNLLRKAAEQGYDGITWVTGEQTADRYDLSKQIDQISYRKNTDGKYYINATKHNNNLFSETNIEENKLESYFGKDIAQRIINGEGESGQAGSKILKGENLKVGGQWAINLYDKVIPNFLNKYAKKWNAKVGEIDLGYTGAVKYLMPDQAEQAFRNDETVMVESPDGGEFQVTTLQELVNFIYAGAKLFLDSKESLIKETKVHSLPITPEMKQDVLYEGQPLFQLKPGQKIPSDVQTKANELIGKFVDKGVTKFDAIIKAVDQGLGRETLDRIFPALKAGYTAYLTNATDEETDKMDSFDYVKKYTLQSEVKTEATPKEEDAEVEKPDNEFTGVSRPFIQRIREEIRKGNVLNKTQLEKIAKEFGITDPNIAKEQAELAIVAEARKIINETPDEKEAYEKLIELYKNQPNLTHRTNESVEKQQYSTPAPIAYISGLYVADEVKAGDVLEPSAGNGMLTIAFNTGQVYVNEIDPVRLRNLRQSGYQDIKTEDSEKNDNLFNKKFDGIMTNPPFGGTTAKDFDGYPLAKLEHIMAANALKQMQDNGRAGIIIGGHNRYDNKGRLKNDRTFFNWLNHYYNVEAVLNVSGELYRKQGAAFPIRVILVNGRKAVPQGASPLFNEVNDAEIKSFTDLYNRIEEIRNGNILRPNADANGGNSGITDVQNPGGAKDQTPSGTKTLPGGQVSGTDTEKPTKPGQTKEPNIRPSGEREPIPGGQPAGSGKGNTGQSPLSENIPGGEQRDTGENDEGGTGASLQDGFDREHPSDVARDIVESEKPLVEYVPQSKGPRLATHIPRNMAYETMKQLGITAKDVGGDIDEYVREKLQYESIDKLFSHLGAEQIDALALAIVAIERNQASITGDMAGIGKGRVAASLIRYAILNGHQPVFYTEKEYLFSDLYRDMVDTDNAQYVPFILNSGPDAKIKDEDGKLIYGFPPDAVKTKAYKDQAVAGYDYIVATYSQVRNESSYKKRGLMKSLAEGNILILDESHNASGESNTSEVFKEITRSAKGVLYLSATFAKRPNNMPIYAVKTAMSEANLSEEGLINAIEKGGVALQEIVSTDLVESRQMIRRERTYEGVPIDYKSLDDEKQAHSEIVDKVNDIMRSVINFQTDYIKPIVKNLDDSEKGKGGIIEQTKGTTQAGISNTPFANKLFNAVDQLLFSLKAEATAAEAIKAIKDNKKPVIAVRATMESFLNYLGLQPGDVIENPDFSSVLDRAIEGVFRITKKDEKGNSTPQRIRLDQLTEEGRKVYKQIKDRIKNTTTGITISPIDKIIHDLNKAGYRVGEITGRDLTLQFRDDGTAIVVKRTEKAKNTILRNFNNWENPGEPRGVEGYKDMALLINASGSTGSSAHAGPKFKDKRTRIMIACQIELNINTEVQKRGRIFRTGQLVLPEYLTISSAIPAEQRMLMMAKKKLKSLDANVSSDQEQAGQTLEGEDFLNKYGDRVVIEYLKENRELNDLIFDPLKLNKMSEEGVDKFTYEENAASKVTGKVAILPTAMQEEFYNEVSQRYVDHISHLNSVNENDLVVKVLPLNALALNSRSLIIGKGGRSPFGKDTYVESVEVDVLKRPHKKEKIDKLIDTYLDGKTAPTKKAELKSEFKEFWTEWKTNHIERTKGILAKSHNIKEEDIKEQLGPQIYNPGDIMRVLDNLASKYPHLSDDKKMMDLENAIRKYLDAKIKYEYQETYILETVIGRYDVNRVYRVPVLRDATSPIYSNAIFLGWKINKNRKNPYAPSAIMLKFAVADSRQVVEIKGNDRDWLNDITSASYDITAWQDKDVHADWDNLIPTNRREVINIVGGNILQGIGANIKGHLVSYTTKNNEVKRGVLLKDNSALEGNTITVPIKRARKVISKLAVGDFIETASGNVVLTNDGDEWIIEVPASKQKGGKYYLDPEIRKVVKEGRFDKWGNNMRGFFSRNKLNKLIDILQDDFGESLRLSQDQINQIEDMDTSYQLKSAKVYQDDFGNDIPASFSKIHEFKLKHPLLKKVKVEFVDPKTVYWTREEIESYNYTPELLNLEKLEKGDFGYEEGKEKYPIEITGYHRSNPEQTGSTASISSRATTSAYTEELIHAIYKGLEKQNPSLLRKINNWERIVREESSAYGIEIPQGGETFAQVMTFSHLGYADETPNVSEVFELPKDILEEFTKILGQGEISSDVLKGNSQRGAIRLPSGKIDNSLKNFQLKRGKQSGIDPTISKAQEIYKRLKSEKGETKDVYPEWVREMREAFGPNFDKKARAIWKRKGEALDYQLKPGTKGKQSDRLSASQIMSNSQGRFPTVTAIKEAKELLQDNFLDKYYKFRDSFTISKGTSDNALDEGLMFEEFARRVVASEKLGINDYTKDIRYEITKREGKQERQFQLRKPTKTREQRFHGYKLESELAREQDREPENGEGNLVDFGVGLGNVVTVTADKIKDFVRNNQLEKRYNLESDSTAKKWYRELLTAPQWFFDKQPELKRIWDIMDRYFVRNINEETAILKEDKWNNSKAWKKLSDLQKKEFLSALEEYEQTQYELQRDEGATELLDWADFADEYNLTPEVAAFLFDIYKPTIETALDMVKDVDRYRIINETETNPYLENYFASAEKKLTPAQLQIELDKAKDEFFDDDPNAQALFENELLRMAVPDEVKAMQLAWANNQNLRTTLAEVLIDKKYESIDGKAYFPSSRLERKYFLSAVKKTTPEEKLLQGLMDDKFFTTSNSLDKLTKIKDDLEAQGYDVKDPGKFAEAQEQILMNAVSQEDILDLALSAGVDQNNPTLEKLVKAIQAKGFSRHFIPKRFIPGFEYNKENFEEAIFKYITSVPFYKNRTIGGKEFGKTISRLKHTGILKAGSINDIYIQELKNKLENRDISLSNGLRAVASTYYLALSPAYLSQQIVQPINTLLPYLPIVAKELGLKTIEAEKAFGEALLTSLQYWGWKVLDKTNRVFGRATRATFGLDRDFLSIIRSLERQGVGKPLRSMELSGQEVDPRRAYNRDVAEKTFDTLGLIAKIAGSPGIAIEDFTRTIGIRAFYNLGKKAGLRGDKLEDFISVNIAKSYGPASGRLAKPPGYYIAGEGRTKPVKQLAQSTIESWLTFKNFAFMNFGQWGKIWRSLRNDNIYRSAGYKLGSQIGLGGLKYIMWSSSILTLMSLIYGMLDIPEDPDEQYKDMFMQLNKLVPGLGDALYKGVASVTFNVDLSSLFSQTAPLEEPFTKDAVELIGGAPVSAIKDIASGRAPRFLRGQQITEKWEEEGIKLGSRKLIPPGEITQDEITKRKLGYTSTRISDAYADENSRQFKSGQYTDIIRDKVTEEIIPLIENGKGKEARDRFREIWNDMKEDNILTDHQKKSITGLNNFISQVVLSRLKENERQIVKDWKNGYSNSRSRSENRENSREREESR